MCTTLGAERGRCLFRGADRATGSSEAQPRVVGLGCDER